MVTYCSILRRGLRLASLSGMLTNQPPPIKLFILLHYYISGTNVLCSWIHINIFAEPLGEAGNLDASLTMRLYVYT